MATRAWTDEDLERALELRQHEGLSWRALSERVGQPVWRLRYVARKLAARKREPARPGGFVEVVPVRRAKHRDSTPSSARITVELPSGVLVHLDAGVRPSHLRELLRAATEPC